MREYAVRRLAQGILLVFVVTIVIFAIMQLMPGDPINLIVDPRVSEEKKAEIRAEWGLDQPYHIQYGYWLSNFLQGDFGTSIRTKQSVSVMIGQRLPYTLALVGTAIIIQFVLAILLGLWAAYRKDTLIDKAIIIITSVLSSVPRFWSSILLILFFSLTLKVLPMGGFTGPKSLIMPVTAIVLDSLSGILRLVKSEVIETYREKYVSTAYAKGLKNKAVLFRHVLRNALIPVSVMFFLSIPWLIGGEVIIENIFAIPGMGNLLWRGIMTQDLPIVQACIFIIAMLTVLCNIIGDLVTGLLDPKIRAELKGGLNG
jgi:peptide/nickel transport system permease protein